MLPRFKSNETDPNGTSCLVEFQTVFFFSGIRDISSCNWGANWEWPVFRSFARGSKPKFIEI